MRETYRTFKEDGDDYALAVAEDLRSRGYEVLSGPTETMVPFCEGTAGKPVMVPGYKIVVDDGRPEYVPVISD